MGTKLKFELSAVEFVALIGSGSIIGGSLFTALISLGVLHCNSNYIAPCLNLIIGILIAVGIFIKAKKQSFARPETSGSRK